MASYAGTGRFRFVRFRCSYCPSLSQEVAWLPVPYVGLSDWRTYYFSRVRE
jgi:hypothetical protein